jgi:hypothetical protein
MDKTRSPLCDTKNLLLLAIRSFSNIPLAENAEMRRRREK